MDNTHAAGDSVRQLFLLNQQIVKRIVAIASEMLEKRAMNHAPSDDEMKQMQGLMGEISENLSTLDIKAQKQIQTFEAEQEKLARQCHVLTNDQNELFGKLDSAEKSKAEMLIQLAKEQAMLTEQEHLCNQAGEERNRLEDEKVQAKKSARTREKELEKWWWVPGYNLYLAIDTLVQDYDFQIQRAGERCEQKQREYEDKTRDLCETQRRLAAIEQETQSCKSDIAARTEEIQNITVKLGETKRELVRWGDLKIKLSNLESKMKSGVVSPDVLLEVLVMMDEYSEDETE
ncbi:MAG: hypothetical protein RR768_11010 [Clostridium sp.]